MPIEYQVCFKRLWCLLTPLTIFQLYGGSQFYRWRKTTLGIQIGGLWYLMPLSTIFQLLGGEKLPTCHKSLTISSPGQRPCELLPSLGVRRKLSHLNLLL
jgi:hypothetical protein